MNVVKKNIIRKKVDWITNWAANILKGINSYNRRNKWLIYAIISVLAVVMIWGPFSEASIVSYAKASYKKNKLQKELVNLQNKYKADSTKLYDIQNNSNALEHIAREEYFMKSPSETIFIISNNKDEK